MKKIYIAPELDLIELGVEDILTMSDTTGDFGGDGDLADL